jgi:hypothetical protein
LLNQEEYHCTDFSNNFIYGEVSETVKVDANFIANYGLNISGNFPVSPDMFCRKKNAVKIFEKNELYKNR